MIGIKTLIPICILILFLNCSESPTSGGENIRDEDIVTFFETEGEEEISFFLEKEFDEELQVVNWFRTNFRYESDENNWHEPRFRMSYNRIDTTILDFELILLHEYPVERAYEIIDYGIFSTGNVNNDPGFKGKVIAKLEYQYKRHTNGQFFKKVFTSGVGEMEIRETSDGNIIGEFELEMDLVEHRQFTEEEFVPAENALKVKGSFRTWSN